MYVCVCECVWGLSSLILVSQLSPPKQKFLVPSLTWMLLLLYNLIDLYHGSISASRCFSSIFSFQNQKFLHAFAHTFICSSSDSFLNNFPFSSSCAVICYLLMEHLLLIYAVYVHFPDILALLYLFSIYYLFSLYV